MNLKLRDFYYTFEMPIKENGAPQKLRINYSQKGDLTILTQEFESAISQTMAQMAK